MSRAAGILLLQLVMAVSATWANAADYGGRKSSRSAHGASGVEVLKTECRAPVVETVRYREQVCRKGVSGYAYCRWVDREHDVRAPETCAPTVTTEGTSPAKRGAFPPFPHG